MMNHAWVKIGGMVAMLVAPMLAWADSECSSFSTTTKERALYDWVDTDFPGFFHTSGDYVRAENHLGVDRNSRCTGSKNDPMYVNSEVTFILQGKALEASQQQLQALNEQGMAVAQKMQDNISAGMSIIEASNQMEPEMKRIDRERAVITARDKVTVRTDINGSYEECQGEKAEVPGAVIACRLDNEDETTQVTALFGAWRKGEDNENAYGAVFDPKVPTDSIQTIAITIVAAGDVLDTTLQQTDWAAIRGRIGHE